MSRTVCWAFLCLRGLFPQSTAMAGETGDTPRSLRVAVVQMGLESTLTANRDKIVRLIREAAAADARLAIFPEGALASPPGTPLAEYRLAVQAVGKAAGENSIYVVAPSRFVPQGQSKHHNQLYVFSPQGETLLVYDKVWHARQYDAPKMVSVDGVFCSFTICADRWSRPVADLPPVMGAQILIECSGNYDTEWLPSLQWYWYVPRAIRNTAYVILSNRARENHLRGGNRGHGHSVVVAPDGSILAAAGEELDKVLMVELDLGKATREMAIRRSQHPLFKAWWEMGQAIHNGQDFPMVNAPSLTSSDNSVQCGFALIPCTSSLETNVKTIRNHIRQAGADKLDLLVFPELAVTGDREEDVQAAEPETLAAAVDSIRQSAREHKVTVVVGSPSYVNGKRRNSAYAIGRDGSILTRYDQIAVNRPSLFESGMSTKAMWFQVNGIWSVVTIGADGLWTEMAELAALRGARLHCHLRHEVNMTPAEALLHDQIIANLASFRTLTVVANPLFPDLVSHPDARFSVGSGVWDDLAAGDWCAVKVQTGRPWERVFSASRVVPGATNPMRQSGYWRTTTPRYQPWMMAGVAAMDAELPSGEVQ